MQKVKDMQLNFQRVLALTIFGLGALIGAIFFGLATWGDLEASLFSSGVTGDENLSTMTCPIMITTSETGQVKAVIENSLDRTVHTAVRSDISMGLLTFKREDTQQLTLEPGEKQTVSWEVTSEDAVWNRVILARLYEYANYPEKAKGGSCGILLVDLPLVKGAQIVVISIILSVLGIISGLTIWERAHRPLKGRARDIMRAMVVLGVIVAAGILSALLGSWFFGLMALILALILTGSVIANLSMS